MELRVPDLVRQRALSRGSSGRAWLDTLPDVVAELARRWDLTLGAAFRGGTSSFVVAASTRSGAPCVLKVGMPLDDDDVAAFGRSILVHRLADGRGCATVLADDSEVPAMLLERLGPNLHDLGLTVDEILATVTRTLETFWRPAPDDAGLPTGADKASWLSSFVTSTWSALGRPCDRRVIERAVAYCDERASAFDPADTVLVHGDAHGWNTLSATAGAFKFVDPEGLRSERAHDLAVPMREYDEPLLAGDTARLVRGRAELLARFCGIDPDPVWAWGFVERVATGLAALRDFEGDEGLAFLEVAERCL